MESQKKNKNLKICVIGPGVVGHATGKYFFSIGFPVTFWGRGIKRVEQVRNEGFSAYTHGEIKKMPYDFNVSIITVPTPTIDGKINLDAIQEVSAQLGERLRETKKYHLVVVKSTVPPGTTESLVVKTLEDYSGKIAGTDFGVCMNPEFLREKTAYEDFVNSRLVLIGEFDKKSGDMLGLLYRNFSCPILRLSIKEAEMQKYTHNLFNAVKISFFNEMRLVCQRFGMDADKIFQAMSISAEGMWNPEYGIRNLGPFDGMCLPKDTQAFLSWAKEMGLSLPILEAAISFNTMLSHANGQSKKDTEVLEPVFLAQDYAS